MIVANNAWKFYLEVVWKIVRLIVDSFFVVERVRLFNFCYAKIFKYYSLLSTVLNILNLQINYKSKVSSKNCYTTATSRALL